jgi:penicillin-binding protein 1A
MILARTSETEVMRVLATLFSAAAIVVVLVAVAVGGLFWLYDRDLPDYRQLANYEPPVTTRVYAGDGQLLAEFATEKRVFVPISAIPQRVIDAFLAAEDKNFYNHPGVDLPGIVRAVITNLENFGSDRRPVGASTITQQVAKNFLLTNEVSFKRKIREAIIAVRMEQAFSKERILELYLNEIYLGRGSYGVATAALNYFDKSLGELTLGEAAFLAALPKAPNNYDPTLHHAAAMARRDWVIGRMLEDGHITKAEADAAQTEALVTHRRRITDVVAAGYFTEEVRRELARRYGEKALYEGGLVVHATIDPRLQAISDRALRAGLAGYDQQRGWRGPVAQLKAGTTLDPRWSQDLSQIAPPPGIEDWRLAAVLAVGGRDVTLGFADGSTGKMPFETMRWARNRRSADRVGPPPRRPSDVVAVNDVILVERLDNGTYALRQVPKVEGALVALDPHTGRVLAMSGGWSYETSEFNRATQAYRQPGSSFKPFVYLAALESGLTPSTIVLDAPFSAPQGPGLPMWTPSNYTDRFYGPTTLRVGLEQSRNVMTVRLADQIGMKRVVDVAKRFGVVDDMEPNLANALGATETTLLRLTTGYGMFVNGGRKITPTLIDRIQDRYGHTIYRHDTRACPGCQPGLWQDQAEPELTDDRPQVTDPDSAYQIVSMLTGVVQRGTGRRVKDLNRPIAGKTGTSNDAKDVWFVGFSPDLVCGVFVGFDEPASLGSHEAGGVLAAPIFRDFMSAALANQPPIPFRTPPGIRLVRVDASNGQLAAAGDPNVIIEAFKPGTVPLTPEERQSKAGDRPAASGPMTGTGGLY